MRQTCCALLFFAALSALGAEVYRSVDENGVVRYSDRPDSDSELVYVATLRGSTTRSAPSQRASEPETEQPPVTGGEIVEGPSAAERAEEKRRNCEIARERVARYRESRRLFRELPDGEREYLSDSEIVEARSSADADVGRWCG